MFSFGYSLRTLFQLSTRPVGHKRKQVKQKICTSCPIDPRWLLSGPKKKDGFFELKSESMNHLQGQLGPLGLPLHDAFSQKNPHQQTNTWVNEVAVGLFAAQPKNHFYHLCHSIPMPCTNSFKDTILHGGSEEPLFVPGIWQWCCDQEIWKRNCWVSSFRIRNIKLKHAI